MTAPTDPAEVTNRDLARGLGGTLLARLGALIDLVAQPVFVALFGLATYGLYAVLWAAVYLLESLANLGMTTALQRVVPQAADEQEAVNALRCALLLGVVPCALIALAISLLAPQVAPLFNAAAEDQDRLVSAVRLFAWALPLWAFVEVATAALRARRLFGAEIRLRVFWEQVLRLVLAGLFYLAGMGIMALFLAHLGSLAITCLLCVRLLARSYDLKLFFRRSVSGGAMPALLGAGLAVLPSNVVTRLYSDAPPIALNALIPGGAGATSAALYIIARKVSSVVYLVRSAFGYVLEPLASAASRGGNENVQALYSYASRLALALVLPLGATLAAGASIILQLFGSGAQAALPALVMLIAARVVEAIAGLSSIVLLVIGGYAQRLIASFAGLGVALAVGLLLVPAHGTTGAAAAVTAGVLIAALISQWQLWAGHGTHPFDGLLARTVARALPIALGAFGLALAARLAPRGVDAALLAAVALGSLWLSARLSLSRADRLSLGKSARKLRLI